GLQLLQPRTDEVEGQLAVFAEVEALQLQAIVDVHIDAGGFQPADVRVERFDIAAGGPQGADIAADDAGASGRVVVLIAALQSHQRIDDVDPVLQLDRVVVDRDVQAGGERRRKHRADGEGVGGFRRQVGVAGLHEV